MINGMLSSKPRRILASLLTLALTVGAMAFGLVSALPAQAIAEPTVTVNQAPTQDDPTSNATIVFDVDFSEPVSGFNLSHVLISDHVSITALEFSPVATAQHFVLTAEGASQPGTITISLTAGAGESVAHPGVFSQASTSTDNTVTWQYPDPQPTVTVDQAAGQADPTTDSPVLFTAVFSQPVALDASAVHYGGSADPTTATVSGSGENYTIAVAGMSQSGSVTVTIPAGAAHAIAGSHEPSTDSTSTDNMVTYVLGSIFVPSVTIDQDPSQTDPASASPILFRVVFDGAVAGFTSSDVLLSGTAGATTATVAGSGPVYTVSVTGMTHSGTVTASIPAYAVTAVAIPHEPNTGSTSTDNTVQYQAPSTPLTVTVSPVAGEGLITNDYPVLLDVTFSRPVTGFAGNDVDVSGTADPRGWGVTGSGADYVVDVAGMSRSGTLAVDLPAGAAQAVDDATSSSASNLVTFTYIHGLSTPAVTIDQAAGQDDPTSTTPVTFDVTFDQPVTGFAADDVHLGGTAGATTAVVTGSGSSYVVAVSGMTQSGSVIATIPAGAAFGQLPADNASLASTSTDNSVTFQAAATTTPSSPTPSAPTTSGSPTTPPSSPTTPAPLSTAPVVGGLAQTGSDVRLLLVLAAGLMAGGAGLLVGARRARPRH